MTEIEEIKRRRATLNVANGLASNVALSTEPLHTKEEK